MTPEKSAPLMKGDLFHDAREADALEQKRLIAKHMELVRAAKDAERKLRQFEIEELGMQED